MASNSGEQQARYAGISPVRTLATLGAWVREKLFGPRGMAGTPVHAPPRAYDVRKQRLPNTFTPEDWERALEYWGYKCAICERPRGLWHTLAQDHWIPLTGVGCPGTVAANILPLCHGEGGCNNSKGKKRPEKWLREKLGARRANRKMREIEAYFAWAHAHASIRPGCPECGAPVDYFGAEDLWQCRDCGVQWDSAVHHTLVNCPTCACFMLERRSGYYCPRCAVQWPRAELSIEWCPGCGRGILRWVEDDDGGYWLCPHCGKEWVDE